MPTTTTIFSADARLKKLAFTVSFITGSNIEKLMNINFLPLLLLFNLCFFKPLSDFLLYRNIKNY